MKCFYHSSDLDGHCSGAIVKMGFPHCEMVGITHGDEFPWDTIEKGEVVYMVDYCLQPFSDMQKLGLLADLIWIDHHKSAIEEYEAFIQQESFGFGHAHLQNGVAGCELTWGFCNPSFMMPRAVRLLGRYDVWDHTDPDVLPFQYGMRLIEDTLPGADIWGHLFSGPDMGDLSDTLQNGATVMKYQDGLSKKICAATAFDLEWEGLRCIVSNAPLCNSKHFASVYDPARHDVMMSFYWKKKGFWAISLYSDKKDVDVSAIAKKHGGGGHKGAAGFQCTVMCFPGM